MHVIAGTHAAEVETTKAPAWICQTVCSSEISSFPS